MRGDDVKALQSAANDLLRAKELPWRTVKVDGECGPKTVKATRLAAFLIGAARPELKKLAKGVVTRDTQELVRGKRPRTRKHRRRAERRHERLERLRARHRKGAAAAVREALSHRGETESPAGSNRGGGIISACQERIIGYAGVAWCGCFSGDCSRRSGGAAGINSRIAYTPFGIADARAGVNGFKGARDFDNATPGDHAFFNFSGGSTPQHTGIVVRREGENLITIEGNTSPGNAGSQSNGGGVFLRTRPRWLVCGLGIPDYK